MMAIVVIEYTLRTYKKEKLDIKTSAKLLAGEVSFFTFRNAETLAPFFPLRLAGSRCDLCSFTITIILALFCFLIVALYQPGICSFFHEGLMWNRPAAAKKIYWETAIIIVVGIFLRLVTESMGNFTFFFAVLFLSKTWWDIKYYLNSAYYYTECYTGQNAAMGTAWQRPVGLTGRSWGTCILVVFYGVSKARVGFLSDSDRILVIRI
jgi:hypothetical protein